jgi:hypothetical protein
LALNTLKLELKAKTPAGGTLSVDPHRIRAAHPHIPLERADVALTYESMLFRQMIITIINIVINLGWGWLLGWPWWLNLILGFCAGSGLAWGGQTNKVPVLSYLIWAIYMACTPVHFLGWPIWIGIVFGLITGTATAFGLISYQMEAAFARRDKSTPPPLPTQYDK